MDFVSTIVWLSINCFYECRKEPQAGQIAVAQVVLNRSKRCKVDAEKTIMLDKQFSWTNGGISDKEGYVNPFDHVGMKELVGCAKSSVIAMSVDDLTNGATFYHTVDVSPYWAKNKKPIMTIGRHIFYSGKDYRCK